MEFRCLQIAVIMSVFKACVSSKNITTIHVCVGEDVTLSCPPAGINKTTVPLKNNDSEPTTTVIPQCSGDAVKGFLTKDKTLNGVIIVLLVLVLIIVSLFGHAYIRIQYKQTNFTVPVTDVVRHLPVQIEMQEISNNEEDPHEKSRNLQLISEILQDLQNAASNDKQSDLSKTNTSHSSSPSNRSQNINEEDYLHPYDGFVHSRMDVHEYATVGIEYEEIIETSKNESRVYENVKSVI